MKNFNFIVICALLLTISHTSAHLRSKELSIRTLVYDEINAVRIPGVNVRILDELRF